MRDPVGRLRWDLGYGKRLIEPDAKIAMDERIHAQRRRE